MEALDHGPQARLITLLLLRPFYTATKFAGPHCRAQDSALRKGAHA